MIIVLSRVILTVFGSIVSNNGTIYNRVTTAKKKRRSGIWPRKQFSSEKLPVLLSYYQIVQFKNGVPNSMISMVAFIAYCVARGSIMILHQKY